MSCYGKNVREIEEVLQSLTMSLVRKYEYKRDPVKNLSSASHKFCRTVTSPPSISAIFGSDSNKKILYDLRCNVRQFSKEGIRKMISVFFCNFYA